MRERLQLYLNDWIPMKKTKIRNITITDLAKILKLNTSTVSRALNNHPDIKEETKQKIKELAQELNYIPNSIAQNLKNKTSNTIGVIVPGIHYHFFSQVISGIEDVAFEHGYKVIVCQSRENYEREVIYSKSLVQNKIAGLLISVSEKTEDAAHLIDLQNKGIPVVFFDRPVEGIQASRVINNDYEGAYQITELLIQQGAKRIAHLSGNPQLYICKERFRGFCAALKTYGLMVEDELVVNCGLDQINGYEGAKMLFESTKKPEALFCINDYVAVGAFQYLNEKNIKIPGEVSLSGFSNIPLADLIKPSLTTIDQFPYKMGAEACKIIMDEIKSSSTLEPKTEIILTKLVIRESTKKERS